MTAPNSLLSEYFDLVKKAYLEAKQNLKNEITYDYRICNFPIRLDFASTEIGPVITPAFNHLLEEDSTEPLLTIRVWDSASTNVDFPIPPWENLLTENNGDMWASETQRYKYYYRPGSGDLNFLDKEANEAIYWTRNIYQFPYYESGAPLRYLLNWWMNDFGIQLVHSGAVGNENGGVLLVGKGGSGKSTTALACLNANFSYVSDDYCMVTSKPKPFAYSVYSAGKLNSQDINRFPKLLPALSNIEKISEEKALYFLHQYFPHLISKGFPIHAILVPELTPGKETKIVKISSAQSYLALAPSTLFQLRGIKQSAQEVIGDLVRQIPSYKIKLGSDINKVADVIAEFLSRKIYNE